MKTKARPIGRIDKGIFTLDEQKHRDFFKKRTDHFKLNFQKWLDQKIEELTKKHTTGHFLIYLRHTKNSVKLKVSFDVEKYRNEKDGGLKIPISDLF